MPTTYSNGVYVGTPDIEDQWNNALANYQARAANPRFVPGAAVDHPDSPDRLRQELLAPLEDQMGAMTGHYPPPEPAPVDPALVGWDKPIRLPQGEVVQPNVRTGQTRVLVQPREAPGKMTQQDAIKYKALLDERRALAGRQIPGAGDADRMNDLNAQISTLEKGFAAPAQPQNDPLAPNPFNSSPPSDWSPGSPNPGSAFIGTPGISRYISEGEPVFRSPVEVKAAFTNGKISKTQAAKILREKFGLK